MKETNETLIKGPITIDLLTNYLFGYFVASFFIYWSYKISVFQIEIKYHVLVLIIVVVLQIVRYFTVPFKFTLKGIQGTNIFGFNSFIKWDEFLSLKESLSPFAVITSKKGALRAIYFPLGVKSDEINKLITKYRAP